MNSLSGSRRNRVLNDPQVVDSIIQCPRVPSTAYDDDKRGSLEGHHIKCVGQQTLGYFSMYENWPLGFFFSHIT